MGVYSKRVWLNKDDSPSTGSVVTYHGPVNWGKGEKQAAFLEVADCSCKVRLHVSLMDTMQEFIGKMELLRDTVDDFVRHLKEAEKPEGEAK